VTSTATSLAARSGIFAGYCVALALAHAPLLRALYDYSRQNETASHVLLIPFVTMALAFRGRDFMFAVVRYAWLPGLSVIAAGLVLVLTAAWYAPSSAQDDALAMRVSAFVVLALGGFLLVYGPAAFRAALFPLLFLAFMIPIPGVVLDGTVWLLRTGSTHAVSALFELTRTPYYREGFVFSLPSVVIEIAEECSGIRSSIALVLTALLAGDMYLESGWKKAILIMATLPLTILKNAIRIATLTLLAIHVDPSFLTGQLHHDGGIVFFLITVALLAPVLAWLRPARTPRVRTA